jgi:hypothetical protein
MITVRRAATPQWVLAYHDDFSVTSSGWEDHTDEIATNQYINGEYRILMHQGGWKRTTMAAARGYTSYRAEVSIRWATPGSYTSGSLCFDLTPWQYYEFEIDTDGDYRLRKRTSDGWMGLVGWTHSDTLYRDGRWNVLLVERVGDNITLWANGHMLTSASDGQLKGNPYLGLAGSGNAPGAEVRFDDFRLYRRSDAVPLALEPSLDSPFEMHGWNLDLADSH